MDKILIEVAAHPALFWFTGAVIAGILEMAVPVFGFIFIALATFVAALFALRFNGRVQWVAFSATLVLSLALIRPRLIAKFKTAKELPTRTSALLGRAGKVTEPLDLTNSGRVLVDGQDWAAQSPEPLTAGETVIVEGSDGIILKVRKA